MFVIVVGCGKIGYQLSRALLAADHEVVVLERDSRRAARAAEELGSVVISSDGTEPTVLTEAGVTRCQLLIATTGQDATNLVACQVAKRTFHVPQTIAVVTDPDHVALFKRLGVDVTISTTELILSHIEEECSRARWVARHWTCDCTSGAPRRHCPGCRGSQEWRDQSPRRRIGP
jgi:trk system potassium uptake protein TrkA